MPTPPKLYVDRRTASSKHCAEARQYASPDRCVAAPLWPPRTTEPTRRPPVASRTRRNLEGRHVAEHSIRRRAPLVASHPAVAPVDCAAVRRPVERGAGGRGGRGRGRQRG